MEQFENLPEKLLELVQQQPLGISEFALIEQLREQNWPGFAKASLREPLSLFRTHFILFHCLYLLDERLAEQGLQLQIHCLSIRLLERLPGQPALAATDPLRSYYLDLQNLADTDAEQVAQILDGSLRRIHGQDELAQALAVLGFAPSQQPSAAQIRTSFRQLVSRHHPDRGGDTAELQKVNQAMAIVKASQRTTKLAD